MTTTTNATPRTPIPWVAEGSRVRSTVTRLPVAIDFYPEDAEYTVRACNTFPALLEAAEALLYETCDECGWWLNGTDVQCLLHPKVRAAIAAARGEA